MTEEPVVSSATASSCSPEMPACFTAERMALASARIWSSCDCVAYSGSSRLRCSGYSETAEPSMPRSPSTMETRTLNVPKSTPATIDNQLLHRCAHLIVSSPFFDPGFLCVLCDLRCLSETEKLLTVRHAKRTK